jgi:transaldolase
MNSKIEELSVKIFADGADFNDIVEMNRNPIIKGLTTNPSLMRKSGVSDYEMFSKEVLKVVKVKPVSFEVFSDNFDEMEYQAQKIASWGENVYVKIPITNSKGISTRELIEKLVRKSIKVNVTAIMTVNQVKEITQSLDEGVPNYISIFAGRIADTGVNPVGLMTEAIRILKPISSSEVIWASPRELLNIFQASEIGCHIITATSDILRKINLIGYNLEEYSLDTVKMFYKDAVESKFNI